MRGKGQLHKRMPIKQEVGDALSTSLREERGPATCRTLFVTQRTPYRPLKDEQIVNAILKDALKGTGQKPVTPYVDRTCCVIALRPNWSTRAHRLTRSATCCGTARAHRP